MLKGAIHLHSTYSDGELALAELRESFLSDGCQFACVTDHAEYFDEDSIRRYIAECASLSDDRFLLVPGLEYKCDRNLHILGYGATKLTQATGPEEVIRHIASQGAVSVIAHPSDDFFPWIETFQSLPLGIEVWNTKYDGRYAPRPGAFALIERLRQRGSPVLAFYGQDLHWRRQFRGMFVEMDCTANAQAILSALRNGNYAARKGEYCLPSSGIIAEELRAEFSRVHDRFRRLLSLLKNGKQALGRLGIRVPDSLKARLRRIF